MVRRSITDQFLSISTPLELDRMVSDDGWIFELITEDVTLHTLVTQKYFVVSMRDVVNDKAHQVAKCSVDESVILKSPDDGNDEEERKWVARNLHYHLKAVVGGDLDTFTLGEWVNLRALANVLKRGVKDLPRDPSLEGLDLDGLIKWL